MRSYLVRKYFKSWHKIDGSTWIRDDETVRTIKPVGRQINYLVTEWRSQRRREKVICLLDVKKFLESNKSHETMFSYVTNEEINGSTSRSHIFQKILFDR